MARMLHYYGNGKRGYALALVRKHAPPLFAHLPRGMFTGYFDNPAEATVFGSFDVAQEVWASLRDYHVDAFTLTVVELV